MKAATKRIMHSLKLIVVLSAGLMLGVSGAERVAAAESGGDAAPYVELKDYELLDQHGSKVRFSSDVVGARIVALNFIYTSCNTACPVVSAIFSKLQAQLGNRLEKDVRMVSLSINPLADTPAMLKAYAERLHAGSNWIWLTGEKPHVDSILKGLGVYSSDYNAHAPVILVGDPLRGVWTRFIGLPSPATITAKIDELLAARQLKDQMPK